MCVWTKNKDQTQAAAPQSCSARGNPIYPLLGTKREMVDAGLSASGVRLQFVYDSTAAAPMAAGGARPMVAKPAVVGALWSSNLHRKVLVQAAGLGALVARGDGRTVSLNGNGAGVFTAEPDINDRLVIIAGGYRYIDAAAQTQESYDSSGKLTAIHWVGGGSATLTYSTAVTAVAPAAGYLVQVQDSYGRSTSFAYQLPSGADPVTGGLLSSITDAQGQSMNLAYDSAGNLASLTWPDGKSRSFHYESASFTQGLTGITDELGVRYATFGYDSAGRAISTEHAGGTARYSTSYSTPPQILVTEVYDSAAQVLHRTHEWSQAVGISVTDPQGASQAMGSTTINGKSYLTSQSQPAGSGCAASTSTLSYDANGNLASRDDFSGHRSCYASDLTRNLQTTQIEGLASTISCASVLSANASLPAGSRKTSTQWHPDWTLPTATVEPGKRTTYVYNGQPDPSASNVMTACAPTAALLPDGQPIVVLCKQIEQATTDANGSLGFAAAVDNTVPARVTSFTYDVQGRVLTSTDALNRSNSYAYYTTSSFTGTVPNEVGHTAGDLQGVTNQAGHVIQFTLYDRAGRVRQMVDPKGIVTDMTYTPRGWISSTSVTPPGGAVRTTSYSYDNAGQLTGVVMPDGSTMSYSYDAAHRLTGVTDAKGNTVTYTLDAMGNKTGEQVKDPSGNLQRNITRVYDALNRVQQVTGASN
ncbi:hypothetical protein [Polaromonas aquatica]|uniref:RHS repeat domain-containing protein n=1 Tax=Polaromonas aquatica TaxID=332657 RepID=UPI003D6568DC